MNAITESEQQALEEALDTAAIMRTVDAVSRLRAELASDESPTIRDELLELHRLALAVRERGATAQLSEFFDLATTWSFRSANGWKRLARFKPRYRS